MVQGKMPQRTAASLAYKVRHSDLNMKTHSIALSVAAAFFLTGCNSDSRVDALLAQVSALEEANKLVAQKVELLEFRNQMLDWEHIAFMKPGDSGYSLVRFDLGMLTAKIVDVKPYANGSKVTLQFGNLSSARVEGLKAKVEWGSLDAKGIAQNDKAKSREMSFKESLDAGSWTLSELVIEGTPPSELGFVRVRDIGHRAIFLSK